MSIKTVKARKALPPANEPYWESLGHGKTLGYRVHKDGHGVWVAKLVSNKSRKVQALSGLIHIPEAEQYHAAVQLANEWFMSHGVNVGRATVGMVCRGYAERNGNPVDDSRCRSLIDGDSIAGITLYALTEQNIEEWKSRHEPGKKTSTVNRQRTFLRAALNDSLKKGMSPTDKIWRLSLKASAPAPGESMNKKAYLSRDQCRSLVEACQGQFKAFIHVLCVIPLRPGALAHALVRDYSPALGDLYIRRDKEHAGRTVPVPGALHALFANQIAGKERDDLLFTMDDGRPWTSQTWQHPIKAAARLAMLPADTVVYTLRHSIITELCINGMDVMTLAKIAGTSLEMIEKHYGHLQRSSAAAIMDGAKI